MLVRLPPEAPSPGRDRRDPLPRVTRLANYEWVFEADITACFDEIDHTALMGRVRRRIGDKRVLGLVKAFLRAGILTEGGPRPGDDHRHSAGRDPLTAAGQHRPVRAGRALRREVGGARPGLDTRQASPRRCAGHAARPLRGRLRGDGRRHPRRRRSAVGRGRQGARSDGPAPVGGEDEGLPHRRGVRLPRLAHPAPHLARAGTASAASTPTRRRRRSWPSWTRCGRSPRRGRHRTLADLLRRLNPVLRGWCNYFRHGVSTRTFSYLDHFAFWRVVGWLRKRHLGLNWGTLRRRFLPAGRSATAGPRCSGRERSRSSATATGARRSRHHGQRG